MSSNKQRRPVVLVFAGPNGSGKTTVTRSMPVWGTYVNADDIKKEYDLSDLEAAQKAEALRMNLIKNGADTSFETVLSTTRHLQLLQNAQERGYDIQCIYVLTCGADINVARVRARCASGGHDVPEEKIRARYARGLELLPRLIDLCDKILIYDNSSDTPVPIFSKDDISENLFPNIYWPEPALRRLLAHPASKN